MVTFNDLQTNPDYNFLSGTELAKIFQEYKEEKPGATWGTKALTKQEALEIGFDYQIALFYEITSGQGHYVSFVLEQPNSYRRSSG